MHFDAFIRDIETKRWPVFGIELWQDGHLLHTWGDTALRHPIYSATKTITAIAALMAAEDGRLDLSRSVLDYLPVKATAMLSPMQQEAYQQLSLHRLMCMSVPGYPFRPAGESWLQMALNCPVQPGEKAFHYSNIPAYLTGIAAAHALQEDLYAYLNRRLFTPLGIDNPPCARCPEGYFYGASGMELSVRELSRIGLTLMNGGEYQGRRLMAESSIQRMTALHQMNREGGYGYFLWKYRDGFSINGKWGQRCCILPGQGLVITFLAHMEEDSSVLTASMEKHLLDE